MDLQENKCYQTNEVGFQELLLIAWQRKAVILLVFMFIFILSCAYVLFKVPVYKMTATISLGNYNSTIYTDPDGAMQVLMSDDLIMKVINELGLKVQASEYRGFKETISVIQINKSNYIQISVVNQDRELGKKIIEKMIEIFIKESEKDYKNHLKLINEQLTIVNQQLKEKDEQLKVVKNIIRKIEKSPDPLTLKGELSINNLYNYLKEANSERITLLDHYLALQKESYALQPVKIMNAVRIPQYPFSTKKSVIIALGSVLGILIGVFAGFLYDYYIRIYKRVKN
ncbi:hypothetical protein [Desulforamulus ruminis]|uniref:hypothetical protein n=1 Tax=Desulforamulus ruminis TaxID=1564 RepID=UPI0023536510|nr:hypothetical protein [Desulforamulus ruminis]